MALEFTRDPAEGSSAAPRVLVPAGFGEPRRVEPVKAAPAPVPGSPTLLAASMDSPDQLGIGDALRPIAELCLSSEAQTPFFVGLLGGRGVGKSYALNRLTGLMAELAGSAAGGRVVTARIDGVGIAGDPATALAAAAFDALERARDGVSFSALADEAAHATTDPSRAAGAAAERHEDITRRLETERAARDELDSRRARLSDALLYDTPGTRVDTMIRSSRASIEAKLRGFGLADGGDGADNFRHLVRDVASLGVLGQFGLVLRSTWAYRGQFKLLMLAATAFIFAFAAGRIMTPAIDTAIRGLGDWAGSVADAIKAHADAIDWVYEALIIAGLLAIAANVWRAFGFTTLLFRALRLLNMDVRERRRELDASASRLERRIAGLTSEAEAASRRAEALAKRAGGEVKLARGPGPVFLGALEAPARAAREFFTELGRLMAAPTAEAPAPKRLIFVFDNLEAMAPGAAARLIDVARALLGSGCAGVVACDPSALAGSAHAAFARDRFEVVFDIAAAAMAPERDRLVARMIGGSNSAASSPDAPRSSLAEPLTQNEIALLASLASLTDGSPRAIKRLHNAYRLARTEKVSRPLVALSLAARMNPDPDMARRLQVAFTGYGERWDEPAGPAELVAAAQAARAAQGGSSARVDAAAAWSLAARYAPVEGI